MKSRVIRKNMIKPYEQALVQAEKSAATVEKYLRSVKAFVAAYEGQKAEKALVLEYKARLGENYTASGANALLAGINGFLRFWGLDKCCVKPFKVQKKVYIPEEKELTREEYVRLVKAAKEKKQRTPCIASGEYLFYRDSCERAAIHYGRGRAVRRSCRNLQGKNKNSVSPVCFAE